MNKALATKNLAAILLGVALVVTFAFAFATPASAASITNIKFDNGQTTTSCNAGQSVNVTFRVSIPSGEVAELGQVDVLGDNLAPALPITLGDELGLQEGLRDVSATVPCPQNTGYYTVELRTAGIYGGQRAITMTDGITSVATFGNAIRVVDSSILSGGGSGSTTVTSDMYASLLKMIADLTKQIADLKTSGPVGGNTKPACPPNVAVVGVVGLQSWLVQNGYLTQAQMNTGPGTYGPKTSSANASATAACK